ncbi:MAG: methyltransferase domain-containing protein [Myxococcales bacterium]|nr:methyltransferase domain-containing protein [Myxococcales bacterium]
MTADGPHPYPAPSGIPAVYGGQRRPDLRAMARPSLRVRVCDGGAASGSAPIGYTRDASMDGCFLATSRVLRVGDILPITLAAGAGDMDADIEVVRVTPEGAGLRIRSMPPSDRKRFRRLVALANSVVGTRNAAQRVLDAGRRTTPPIRDPAQVRALFCAAIGERLRMVAADQDRMWEGTIEGQRGDVLTVRLSDPPDEGTPVYAVLDHAHVNYAFAEVVRRCTAAGVEIGVPIEVGFAERRSRERTTVEGASLALPLPGAPREFASFPVIEIGEGGLSVLAGARSWVLGVGAPLSGAQLLHGEGARPLDGAVVVRVLRGVSEAGGPETVRVGIATGPDRRPLVTEQREVVGGWMERLRARLGDLLGRASLRPGTTSAPSGPPTEDPRVRFLNRRGQKIVGLLDFAEPDCALRGATMPLVLVVPGFSGRKEQMSQLATTLVDTFRRHHQDIAVLRFDGTNNLGESEKDPGNEVDGKHTLHYRLSGVESDVLGALDWCQRNDRVRPSSIIVVSVSFAASAVMHLLANPEVKRQFPEVGLWVSYMGAPDPRDAILHVSGHHDTVATTDEEHGLVTLIGCVVDGHAFWSDAQALGLGTLVESERDMAQINTDVLWIAGQYDGWMDLARVRRVMEVAAKGARRLIVADTGHVPKTGREAQRQFALITQEVWAHVHKSPINEWYPPLARLRARERAEWLAARGSPPPDPEAFWRRYLLASSSPAETLDGHLGFDVLVWYPSYRAFIESQADALNPAGLDVLELGAGTGNLTQALHARHPRSLLALDLVPEALIRLREKVPGVATAVVDLDGTPRTAMRRFAAGELRSFSSLRGRVPVASELLTRLDQLGDPRVYAAASGRTVDLRPLVRSGELSADASRALAELAGLHDGPGGLPLPDASVDRVAMSLVLSYLQQPDDVLFEIRRVLRPGGELVISSMVRDADTSAMFTACVQAIQAAPDSAFGRGGRAPVLEAARHMLDASSELFRLEEEGYFRFTNPAELADRVTVAGFEVLQTGTGFGSPGQAVWLRCRRLP